MSSVTASAIWGAEVSAAGTKFPGDGSDYCGGSGSANYRVANAFDPSIAGSGSTISKVELSINVASVTSAGSLLWDILSYLAAGLASPEIDTGADMYAGCASGNLLIDNSIEFRTTGLKTIDLGAQAVTDVQAALDGGNFYSLAIRETTDTTAASRCEFTEYTDGTNPPKLIITYTAVGAPTPGATESETPLAAPTISSVVAGDGQNTIAFSTVSGAISYNLYWSTTTGVTKVNGTGIYGITSPYPHTGLTNGVEIFYIVTAEDDVTESDESSESSGTPAVSGIAIPIAYHHFRNLMYA